MRSTYTRHSGSNLNSNLDIWERAAQPEAQAFASTQNQSVDRSVSTELNQACHHSGVGELTQNLSGRDKTLTKVECVSHLREELIRTVSSIVLSLFYYPIIYTGLQISDKLSALSLPLTFGTNSPALEGSQAWTSSHNDSRIRLHMTVKLPPTVLHRSVFSRTSHHAHVLLLLCYVAKSKQSTVLIFLCHIRLLLFT